MPILPTERIQNIAGVYGALQQLGGGPSPASIASSIAAVSTIAGQIKNSNRSWRPPQWGQQVTEGNSYNSMTAMFDQLSDGTFKSYFFDAVIAAQHTTRRQITDHPVQWGAAISDHSYQLPAMLTLEIGMSDAMTSFDTTAYSATGGQGKSVNAYQEFVQLQKTGRALVVDTHLKRYENMVIESISAPDNSKTTYSLRCSITFKEIFIGTTGKIAKSLLPDNGATTKKNVTAEKIDNGPLKDIGAKAGLPGVLNP